MRPCLVGGHIGHGFNVEERWNMRVTEYDGDLGPYCELEYDWSAGLREYECIWCNATNPIDSCCPCD